MTATTFWDMAQAGYNSALAGIRNADYKVDYVGITSSLKNRLILGLVVSSAMAALGVRKELAERIPGLGGSRVLKSEPIERIRALIDKPYAVTSKLSKFMPLITSAQKFTNSAITRNFSQGSPSELMANIAIKFPIKAFINGTFIIQELGALLATPVNKKEVADPLSLAGRTIKVAIQRSVQLAVSSVIIDVGTGVLRASHDHFMNAK